MQQQRFNKTGILTSAILGLVLSTAVFAEDEDTNDAERLTPEERQQNRAEREENRSDRREERQENRAECEENRSDRREDRQENRQGVRKIDQVDVEIVERIE